MSSLKHNAYKKAADVITSLSIDKIPISVEKIAKKYGAKIRFSPMENNELSGMVFIKDGVPIIGVNALHHPNRQRFTIAHELGHLELHREIIEQGVHVDTKFFALKRDQKSATGQDGIEIEANSFASELLMPSFLLEKAIEEVIGDGVFDIESSDQLDRLASKFKVSRDAMQFRLLRLME